MYSFKGSLGISSSVRPSTSSPVKRVEGEEDITNLGTLFFLQAFLEGC